MEPSVLSAYGEDALGALGRVLAVLRAAFALRWNPAYGQVSGLTVSVEADDVVVCSLLHLLRVLRLGFLGQQEEGLSVSRAPPRDQSRLRGVQLGELFEVCSAINDLVMCRESAGAQNLLTLMTLSGDASLYMMYGEVSMLVRLLMCEWSANFLASGVPDGAASGVPIGDARRRNASYASAAARSSRS